MIWKKCLLQRAADTTKDELGNEVVGAWKTVKKTVCRFTPWMDEQIALEGREVTKHEQQYLVPIPYCKFPECERAVLMDVSWISCQQPTYRQGLHCFE